jgi:adenosylcobinamide-GDP ribazoletransferase
MILRTIATAFEFLTIISVRTNREVSVSEKEVRNSVSFFPLVGAVQGLFLAFLTFLFLKITSADVTAAIVLVFYAMITGGFHQDGLSDTFDALSVPSSGDSKKDKTRRLQVMKDSTVGPIGVIAIVLSLLLKYVLMRETLQTNNCTGEYFIVFLMPVFSKWAMVTGMYHTKSARMDGIGRTFLEHTGLKQVASATTLLLSVTFVAAYVLHYLSTAWFPWSTASFILFFFSEMALIFLACLILKYVFTARFGGLTGDNFGAMHEISEILFLTFALLWR